MKRFQWFIIYPFGVVRGVTLASSYDEAESILILEIIDNNAKAKGIREID